MEKSHQEYVGQTWIAFPEYTREAQRDKNMRKIKSAGATEA